MLFGGLLFALAGGGLSRPKPLKTMQRSTGPARAWTTVSARSFSRATSFRKDAAAP